MYHGGDLLDLLLITIFCGQWYVATGPQRRVRPTRSRRAWRLPAGW
jgi:putative membrane protein